MVYDVRTGKGRNIAPNLVMKHYDWYSYSLDRSKIIVVDGGERWGNCPKVLLEVNPKTWTARKLTKSNVDSIFPAWSPDNTRLAYIENKELRNRRIVSREEAFKYNRLSLLNTKTKRKTYVTTGNTQGDWYPMWCGDSKTILFLRDNSDETVTFWLVQDTGKNLRPLSNGPSFPVNKKWTDSYDFWAPNKGWRHR